jgi:hypothetical protein
MIKKENGETFMSFNRERFSEIVKVSATAEKNNAITIACKNILGTLDSERMAYPETFDILQQTIAAVTSYRRVQQRIQDMLNILVAYTD